jgi:hypothetical protein
MVDTPDPHPVRLVAHLLDVDVGGANEYLVDGAILVQSDSGSTVAAHVLAVPRDVPRVEDVGVATPFDGFVRHAAGWCLFHASSSSGTTIAVTTRQG